MFTIIHQIISMAIEIMIRISFANFNRISTAKNIIISSTAGAGAATASIAVAWFDTRMSKAFHNVWSDNEILIYR